MRNKPGNRALMSDEISFNNTSHAAKDTAEHSIIFTLERLKECTSREKYPPRGASNHVITLLRHFQGHADATHSQLYGKKPSTEKTHTNIPKK